MKFAPLLRASALLSAVALLPTATAGLAQVEGEAAGEFDKLFASYERIKAYYVDEISDDVLAKGAVDGMLKALDPHSAYLDGQALQRLETLIDGEYEGLGISVTMDDGAVKVISPMRGSPAEQAGVKAGDYITHLDGSLIYGLTLDEAVSQMRGPAGTTVGLTIFRQGRDEPLDIDVTRGVIELEPVTHELKPGGIGVVSINEFSKDVGRDTFNAIRDMQRSTGGRLNGIVLDLRSNPGGSLREAIALSDLFLSDGMIVAQRGRSREDNRSFPAETLFNGEIAKNVPMIVLIDVGSASASEIVAGALQDQHRALVMGERSFGKGSVQTMFYLDDAHTKAVKLTTARYYTPAGRSVQEGGIEPDIVVPQLSDPDAAARMKRAVRESDLRRHLINEIDLDDQQLETDKLADPRFQLTSAELEDQGIDDFQLHYALETLRRARSTTIAAR